MEPEQRFYPGRSNPVRALVYLLLFFCSELLPRTTCKLRKNREVRVEVKERKEHGYKREGGGERTRDGLTTGHLAVGILSQAGIQNGIRDLVTDLI